jgi:hypothetical protein
MNDIASIPGAASAAAFKQPPAASAGTISGGARAGLAWIIGALVVLGLLVAAGLRSLSVPEPAPATAAATQFSAVRAMMYLHHIAAAPHPIGSRENAAVRDYLVAELQARGARPQVQAALAASASNDTAGYVNNIVARIPGSAPGGKAVLLAAHYDSVPNGYGAADDGASVAAILETLRGITSGAKLKNDVIVLLSDGEEAGLLGAEAFVAGHPWAKEVGVALNFEYRGNAGPMLMFETSADNGKLVKAFAGLAHPIGNSLLGEVYKLMPNDTDMSAFKRAGLRGMNFAAMEQTTAYHTQLDRPDALNQGSLQHQGDIMLALTRHFGDANLNELDDSDQIYFDLPVLGMVRYPAALALPLAAVMLVLCGVVVVRAVRHGALRAGRIAAAALLLPLLGIVVGAACTLLWLGASALHPQYKALMDPYNVQWYRAGLVALGGGLFALLQMRLHRRFQPLELALGSAVMWVVLLAASAVAMPGASFIFTWPLLPLLLAYGWMLAPSGVRAGTDRRLVVLVIAAAPAVLLFAPLTKLMLVAFTIRLAGVAVFFMVLLLGLLAPMLALLRHRFMLPALPLGAGVVCLAAGSLTSGISPQQPHPTNLMYVVDGKGDASWVSSDATLDPWQKSVLGAGATRRPLPEVFGPRAKQYWTAPAPALDVPGPDVTLIRDDTSGATREVAVHIRSPRNAPEIRIAVEGTDVLDARMAGHAVTKELNDAWVMFAYGVPAQGTDITFHTKPGHPFVLRVIDRSYGLPTGTPIRGASAIAQPFGMTDSIRAVSSLVFQ